LEEKQRTKFFEAEKKTGCSGTLEGQVSFNLIGNLKSLHSSFRCAEKPAVGASD